jgi:amino acid transporter
VPGVSSSATRTALPETATYRLKRRLLGKPLVSEQLSGERLSSPVALGVLSPDCISSTAYGTEEMLTILVPAAGVAAFALVLPVTIAILVVLFFVTLSYREVVTTYTKAGGSYVVARDNFGLNVAQISAVALLIDYTVTVAVQAAAGTNALTSAVPSLSSYQVPITVGVVVLLVFANLRGLREAGRVFAIPTYLFIFATGAVIVVGLVRDVISGLPQVHAGSGAFSEAQAHPHTGFLMGVSVFLILKAFANGGSSLTGLEAISNGVGAFRPPEGPHARRVLVVMAATLGFLVLGVSLLAHITHATPYHSGSPTVLSQEAKAVFGSSAGGQAVYYIVQAVTLLILYTGANTSFNGFPFLASFVAEDRFLPFKLTKRGHRLVFSNGILVLAVVSIALLLVTRAKVDSLVAVYAIGVFTGFTMAGLGMAKHHYTHRDAAWRRKMGVNGFTGFLSLAVVVIFAVTKFSEGAWVVVILFPIMWFALIRLNRRYREEASVLGETAAEAAAEAKPLRRQVALILVDRLDLATARAIQYARTFNVDELRAVHFVIDTARAKVLEDRWVRLGLSRLPLQQVECPDRRVVRACLEMAYAEAADDETEVNVLLPRRSYKRGWSRFLHNSNGERIAATLSRVPHVNATIVPFDVDAELADRRRGNGGGHDHLGRPDEETEVDDQEAKIDEEYFDPVPGCSSIGSLHNRERARVAGRVRSVTVQPWGSVPTLECDLTDDDQSMTVAFLGRRQIPGIEPGVRVVVDGTVGMRRGRLMMINPDYELLPPPDS